MPDVEKLIQRVKDLGRTQWDDFRDAAIASILDPANIGFFRELLKADTSDLSGMDVAKRIVTAQLQTSKRYWANLDGIAQTIADALESVLKENARPRPTGVKPRFERPNVVITPDGKRYTLKGPQQAKIAERLFKARGRKVLTRNLLPANPKNDPPRVDKIIKAMPPKVRVLFRNDKDGKGYYVSGLR